MDFRFAFWNCAMSPPGQKGERSLANMTDAVEIIAELFTKEKFCFWRYAKLIKTRLNIFQLL